MKKRDLKILIKEIARRCVESRDYFEPLSNDGQKMYFSYTNTEVIHSVFIIGLIQNVSTLYAYITKGHELYCSNPNVDSKLQTAISQSKNLDDGYVTHVDLQIKINRKLDTVALPEFKIGKSVNDGYKRGTHGRIYTFENQFYIHFWEKRDVIKQYQKELFDYLKHVGIDPLQVQYQPGDFDSYLDSEELFGIKTIAPEVDSDEIKRREDLHLNTDLKKKILKIPPHKLQKVADKLNMPLAQFKQYMGMSVAEDTAPTTRPQQYDSLNYS